ncbi:MAG TPA: hypothetical protein VGM37_00620 [Armatimonadota bacterium]|jgi:hypothetical protein
MKLRRAVVPIALLVAPFARSAPPAPGGLVECLAKTMAGQPVVAADPVASRAEMRPEFHEGDSLVSRLQSIGEAASTNEVHLIPFAVRGAWALASEYREEPRTDYSALTAMDTCSRGLLIDIALGGLTKEQARSLASEEGLAAASLSKTGREALSHALRPPISAIRVEPAPWTSTERTRPAVTTVSAFPDALNLSALRVRARVRMHDPDFPFSNNHRFSHLMIPGKRSLPELRANENRSAFEFFTTRRVPALSLVPNRLKPSDLDGRRLLQPIGMEGISTVGAVLDRAAAVTGLRFSAVEAWRAVPAFVGSAALSTGDVLDSLRLSLDAAWRKLGDSYLLVWDRRGLGALQALAEDGSAGIAEAGRRLEAAANRGTVWKTLAQTLPLDAEFGVALSAEQRDALLNPPPEDERLTDDDLTRLDQQPGGMAGPRHEYRFAELSPDQQETVRSLARSGLVLDTDASDSGAPKLRPITDAEMQDLAISNRGSVELQLKLPGVGWTRAPRDWQAGEFVAAGTRYAPPDDDPDSEEGISPIYLTPKKGRPASAWIGVMVPPLRSAGMAEIGAEMKRRKAGVLFYPLLVDGYATFPSAVFPRHPALGGANGWASASAEARKDGIRLVGVVSMLAWQAEGDGSHWLRKHPDWADVDIAGRTWTELLAARPSADPIDLGFIRPTFARANYVRPNEPAVRARLEALIAEAARLPGCSGIALTEIAPPPALGYALPERLAAFRVSGKDPVDAYRDGFRPRSSLAWEPFTEMPDPSLPVKNPALGLASALTARARALRKDWRVYWAGDATGAASPPDQALSMGTEGLPAQGCILPMPSRERILHSRFPKALADVPYMSVANHLLALPRGPKRDGVVFDYRAAPDTLFEGLKWLDGAS